MIYRGTPTLGNHHITLLQVSRVPRCTYANTCYFFSDPIANKIQSRWTSLFCRLYPDFLGYASWGYFYMICFVSDWWIHPFFGAIHRGDLWFFSYPQWNTETVPVVYPPINRINRCGKPDISRSFSKGNHGFPHLSVMFPMHWWPSPNSESISLWHVIIPFYILLSYNS